MEKITSEQIKQPSERSTRHGPKKITVVVAVIVTILAVLAVFIYVIFFEFPAPSMYQQIWAIKDSTATATTWAVSQIFTSDRGPISKSDVYVTLKNASGFIMQNVSLATASGTHGFLYQPVNAGDYISLGDVFSLSKNYQQGSSIELTTWDAKGQYALLSV